MRAGATNKGMHHTGARASEQLGGITASRHLLSTGTAWASLTRQLGLGAASWGPAALQPNFACAQDTGAPGSHRLHTRRVLPAGPGHAPPVRRSWLILQNCIARRSLPLPLPTAGCSASCCSAAGLQGTLAHSPRKERKQAACMRPGVRAAGRQQHAHRGMHTGHLAMRGARQHQASAQLGGDQGAPTHAAGCKPLAARGRQGTHSGACGQSRGVLRAHRESCIMMTKGQCCIGWGAEVPLLWLHQCLSSLPARSRARLCSPLTTPAPVQLQNKCQADQRRRARGHSHVLGARHARGSGRARTL